MAKDVVCGMTVNEKTAKYKTEWNGGAYYFCGPGCLAGFKANPAKYVK